MITLYGSPTSPNVLKVRVMLEETGIDYEERRVKREEGENRSEAFLAMSPNGTLPVIVDDDTGASVFESSAILLYLADRSGNYLPEDPAARADVYKWLVFEIANVGPVLESIYKLMYLGDDWTDAAIEFHRQKLTGVIQILDAQLAEAEYIAGDCSIADFTLFPLTNILEDFLERPLSEFPNIARWCEQMQQRPGVIRASSGTKPN